MGLFVTFSAEELREFEQWRKANVASNQVVVIEPVSRRRPNSFKVWFEKPLAATSNLRWYKPIEEADGASTRA
jgi:hypothetical protein